MKNDVIIIGGHVQALGIVRILGKLGIKITVMDTTKNNLARHSKYCSGFEKYHAGGLLHTLIKMGKSGYKGGVLFPTNDLHVGIISRNKAELSKYFIVATDNWAVVENCYNKRKTYQLAKQLNIPIPETWMPNSLEEINALDLNYPIIIKPAVMHSFYSKLKKKVFVCNNKEELIKNYLRSLEIIPNDEILIQAIIDGGSDHLFSACFLFDRDAEIQSFAACRARQHPPDFGNATTFAHTVNNKKLIDISKRFLKEIKYRGVCEVEFKFDERDQQYKLLEINPRTWKWHSITEVADINLLENYYHLLLNKPLNITHNFSHASFRHLVTDIPTLFTYKIKNLYKAHPRYATKYAVWDKDDILPAFFELFYLPYLILNR